MPEPEVQVDTGREQAREEIRRLLREQAVSLQGIIRAYVVRMGIVPEEQVGNVATEVFHEAVMEALAHAERFDPSRHFAAWFLGIAATMLKRKRTSLAKRYRFEVRASEMATRSGALSDTDFFEQFAAYLSPGPEQELETREQVREMLALVSADDAKVLELSLLHELDADKVAQLVGGFLALFATRHGGVGSPHGSWCIASYPHVQGYSTFLYGVAVVSANDVWVVGTQSANSGPRRDIFTPLIEHWDGQQWKMMSTLRSPLGGLQAVSVVSVVSATDVWAVGSVTVGDIFGKKANYWDTLVEHWDGTQWSVVPSPNLYTGGSAKQGDTNTLMAVSALSANDVWMVGSSTSATKKSTLEPGGTWTEKLIEHWDGKQVTIVPSPNPALTGTMLKGVVAIAADNVWTVGWDGDRMGKPAIVEHWDGKRWSVVPVVEGFLSAISAVSAQDVWAVGGLAVPGVPSTAVVEHWDGTHWQNVPSASPNKSGTYSFESVAAVSADNVWAVGRYYAHNGDESPLIEHWDGKTWAIVSSPNRSNSTFGNYSLVSVSAAGEHALWSVGNGIANTGSGNIGLVEKACS